MRYARLFPLAAATMLLAGQARAQDGREIVLQFVRAGDTAVVIRGAQIVVDHVIEAGNTDANGKVTIPDLEDGGHIVEAVVRGYQAYFDNFTTGPNTKVVRFELLPVLTADTAKAKGQPTELKLAGLAARRGAAQGKFLTAAQLAAATGRPLANVLEKDLGAFIANGPKAESFAALAGDAKCFAAVVRDGLRIYPYQNAAPLDLDKIFAEQLQGLEYYAKPASVPTEIKEAGKCGALVLWSK